MGYKISFEERRETCFPEDKDEFERGHKNSLQSDFIIKYNSFILFCKIIYNIGKCRDDDLYRCILNGVKPNPL